MPITTPPTAPSRTDPTTFPDRADAWVAWQETSLVPQINALEADVNARQAAAAASASAAQADRLLCQAAATAVAAQSPVANAAAAANSAAQAAVYASQAQATNPDSPIRLNSRIVTADFTVPSAYNAASAGPLAIGEGVTVTVQDNATWSIH